MRNEGGWAETSIRSQRDGRPFRHYPAFIYRADDRHALHELIATNAVKIRRAGPAVGFGLERYLGYEATGYGRRTRACTFDFERESGVAMPADIVPRRPERARDAT